METEKKEEGEREKEEQKKNAYIEQYEFLWVITKQYIFVRISKLPKLVVEIFRQMEHLQ